MNLNQTFSFVKNRKISPDYISLIRCYQPILGLEAFALYHLLLAWYDNGVGRYALSQLLNQLNFGTQKLAQAFDLLMGMGLLDIYQEEGNLVLLPQAPLAVVDFLAHPAYQALLTKKIGEAAVSQLSVNQPTDSNITKSFSQVFDMEGNPVPAMAVSDAFNLEGFKELMAKDDLRFADEKADVLALIHVAEKEHLSWVQVYQLAKATAVGQVISVKRLMQKATSPSPQTSDFSTQERAVIRELKAQQPLDFLTFLKNRKKAVVTQPEKAFLQQFAGMGLLDEVINAIVFYTLSKVDSANLNEKYALKVANDFSYKGIASAEEAIIALRDKPKGKTQKKTSNPVVSNIPEWSKKEVSTEKTAHGQAQLDALRQQMLANEAKGGD